MPTTTAVRGNRNHPKRNPRTGLVCSTEVFDPRNPDDGFGDGRTIIEVTVNIRQEPWQNHPHVEITTWVSPTRAQAPEDSIGRPMPRYLSIGKTWASRATPLAELTDWFAEVTAELDEAGIDAGWFTGRLTAAVDQFNAARAKHNERQAFRNRCQAAGVTDTDLAVFDRVLGNLGGTFEQLAFLRDVIEVRKTAGSLTEAI